MEEFTRYVKVTLLRLLSLTLLVTGLLILFALSALIFMGRKIYMDRQNKKAK